MNHANVISHGCHEKRLSPLWWPTLTQSATAVPAQMSGLTMRITWYTRVVTGLSKLTEKLGAGEHGAARDQGSLCQARVKYSQRGHKSWRVGA